MELLKQKNPSLSIVNTLLDGFIYFPNVK